jgi:hypothetical protein
MLGDSLVESYLRSSTEEPNQFDMRVGSKDGPEGCPQKWHCLVFRFEPLINSSRMVGKPSLTFIREESPVIVRHERERP